MPVTKFRPFRAYVANVTEEDGLKVATGRAAPQQRQRTGAGMTPRIPELAPNASRQDMISIGRSSSSEYAKLRHVVRKWVHEQTHGPKVGMEVEEGVLSPPQVLRAVNGLGKRGTPAEGSVGNAGIYTRRSGSWDGGRVRKIGWCRD